MKVLTKHIHLLLMAATKAAQASMVVALALMVVTLAGCTAQDDVVEATQKGNVSFSLGATRANTGDYVGDALDCELIKWYRVVITPPASRNILLTIDKTLTTAQELDPMDEIQLGPGTYNVYAFANIDLAYLNGLGIKTGGTVPANLSTLRYKVADLFNATPDADDHLQGALVSVNAFAAAGKYIPMTSLAPQQVQVTERVNQTFSIEVRRLFAKLEFVFRNHTPHDLQVNSIAVSDMTVNGSDGNILLMNYEENRNSLNLPYGMPTATLSHTFASPSVIDSEADEVSHSFYVLESKANTVSQAFDLAINVTRKGQSPTGDEADYMRYALTDPTTLTLIHRNDWIRIPMTFSDWQMRLEARTYPPIGGYPEAEIEETESDEFIVTFHGGGDFTIRPFMRKYYDGSDWFGLDNTTKVSGTPEIEVQDGVDKLFTKAPVLTSTGEIRGKMGVFPGRSACVTLRVKVIVSDSPLMTKTLTRKIYITQK